MFTTTETTALFEVNLQLITRDTGLHKTMSIATASLVGPVDMDDMALTTLKAKSQHRVFLNSNNYYYVSSVSLIKG